MPSFHRYVGIDHLGARTPAASLGGHAFIWKIPEIRPPEFDPRNSRRLIKRIYGE
jgi:hypothetical protein